MRAAPTRAEHRLWQALRLDALGVRARRQFVIRGWIVDFYIPSAALVIEVDGESHTHRVALDALRSATLEAEGLRVLRFTNAELIDNLPGVLATIAAALSVSPPRISG